MDVPLAEDREFAMLDQAQINTLNAVERMGATLSLLGISLVFVTFAVFKRLRTIPNTFIFFASIANIGACVACLIAYDGISAMSLDRSAPLCQAQGFIFEWFMQSDPWWSFAMAINVYMVFFMQFNLSSFRRYIWLYCLICYGLPAIPAFVFLFIRSPRGLIYGDAVLWCWIASEWNVLRIYSYYLPIWVCSVLSAVIYFAVGYHVFHTRNQLRNLSLSNQGKEATYDSTDVRDSAEKHLTKSACYCDLPDHEMPRSNMTPAKRPGGNTLQQSTRNCIPADISRYDQNLTSHPGPGYYGTVTTEVQVTSAAMPTKPLPAYTNPFRDSPSRQTDVSTRRSSDALDPCATTPTEDVHHEYASAAPILPVPNAPGAMAPIHTHNYPWSREPSSFSPKEVESSTTPTHSNTTPFSFSSGATAVPSSGQASNFETTNHGFNTAQYTSISAGSSPHKDDRGPSPTRLLSPISKRSMTGGRGGGGGGGGAENGNMTESVTNSSREDGYALRHQHTKTVHHHVHPVHTNIFRRLSDGTRRFGARLKHMDPVKLAYLRTSFVFAISVLVTWTPSSINRVYTLIYPDKASYGLNIAAAVVLPLQGVWNAVIYFTTSWKIFREEMESTRAGKKLFRFLRLYSRNTTINGMADGGTGTRQSGGSLALGALSSSAPRSEMGRNRRLEDERSREDGGEEMEMQSQSQSSPMSSPQLPQRRMQPMRASTMRVTQKQFEDLS